MTTNGSSYDLIDNLDMWSDENLVKFLSDTEVSMSIEKYQLAQLAAELASRYEDYVNTDEDEEEDVAGDEEPAGHREYNG